MKMVGWVGVALLVLFASSRQASATTVLELSDSEMAQRAETIILGRCIASESHWDADHVKIYTEFAFDVTEYLKGGEGDAVYTVRQFGGVVGNRGFYIPGIATFRPNEEVVAFFGPQNARTGTRFTVGLAQGKYSVREEEGSGRKVLTRDLGGLSFLDEETQDLRDPVPADGAPVLLDDLRAEILKVVGKERK